MTQDAHPRPRFAAPLGRREFLAGSAALGAIGLAGPRTAAAEPQKGGHLRIGLGSGSTSDTLDPATFDSTFNQTFGYGTLRNSLTQVSPDNEIVSELAESWEATPDAATWVFRLRDGVEFHNGKTMTAEDVVASLNHHRGPDSTSGGKPLLAAVTDIRASAKNEVTITLEAGNADFPYYMSDYHFAILPSEDGKVDAMSGIGTGAFVLETFEPGVRGLARRNPNYFKEGLPYFDSVEFITLLDVAARTNALATGEIDYMERVDLKTVHLMKRRPGVVIAEVTGTQHYTMPMITTADPFSNNDVRLALKHAIDREQLLESILRGYGRVGNDTPIAPANRYYAELEQRTYDPDKARFHAKKAGMDNLEVSLSAADAAFAGAVDAAVLFKEQAAKAGITVNVVREPNDGYWSNVWMKKPFCMCYWGGRPTADQMFQTAYAEGVSWNDTNWSHERFNKLLLEARPLLDAEKRAEIYREMQMIVRDEGGTIVPLFASYVDAHSDKLAHGKVAGNWALDGMKIAERWWKTA